MPHRFDYELPGNQRKLDVVEALVTLADEAGLSLTHLAMAFVLEHPGVTSAIIGPAHHGTAHRRARGRRRRPSTTTCSTGSTSSSRRAPTSTPADAGWQPPALTDPAARRLPQAARSVA